MVRLLPKILPATATFATTTLFPSDDIVTPGPNDTTGVLTILLVTDVESTEPSVLKFGTTIAEPSLDIGVLPSWIVVPLSHKSFQRFVGLPKFATLLELGIKLVVTYVLTPKFATMTFPILALAVAIVLAKLSTNGVLYDVIVARLEVAVPTPTNKLFVV